MDVAVLGATGTGQAIVGYCADAGHAVRLYDDDASAVMDAIDDVEREYGIDATESVDGTTGLGGAVGDADLVVDAGDDAERDRRERLAAAEELIDPETLVAVGDPRTSVTGVAAGLRQPGRAVGLHPVDDDASVVEVVVAEATTADARDRATEVVEDLGATPVVVGDAPGLASARLELAAIVEAVRLVEEGVATVEGVDAAMERGRGRERGPLARADKMGLDRVLEGLEDLTNRLDGRFEPPGLLREKVADGDLGVRTGTGFYEWEDGERARPAGPSPGVEVRSAAPEDPREL
ncbi:3-hydroxyacyl-CoA dehydrogenase family protein [Halomicrobium urmianum]|uniref:3-hydroxyacyl-CoA dehydrogenase family protein n=1 Tax=Halomicrobium urmianum TaxID=1586233 RepID=UPI001CD9CB2C|nr:3-hydroxyacyl-CoA dehydrogenase family protein [Halomicrobium urmianum]